MGCRKGGGAPGGGARAGRGAGWVEMIWDKGDFHT